MALDLHSKVKIKSVDLVEISSGIVFFRLTYRVKNGRKDYKIWVLPEDLQGTGIMPLCYRRMLKYGDVLDMSDNVLYTGKNSECRNIVMLANKRYYEYKGV